jgi:hypothetical protein
MVAYKFKVKTNQGKEIKFKTFEEALNYIQHKGGSIFRWCYNCDDWKRVRIGRSC